MPPDPVDHGIAIFGGTFDPVHFGHLRSALEVREALQVRKVKLVPAYRPPHRDTPGSTPSQRLDMLRLATREAEFLEVDDRELRREGKSYTIDTLRSLREEFGDNTSLTMVLGRDAFELLHEWREWKSLTDYAHLAVVARTGGAGDALPEELTAFSDARAVDDPLCLQSRPAGLVCNLELTRLDISATKIREMFRTGRSPDYIMPREVIRYIRENGLYGATS